jgi:hypothetical protein
MRFVLDGSKNAQKLVAMVQWHDFWQVFSMLTVSQVGVILGAYLAFMAFLGKDQRQIKTAPAVDATLRLRRSEGFVWWVAWRLSLSKVGRHWKNDEKSIRTCAHATCCSAKIGASGAWAYTRQSRFTVSGSFAARMHGE